MNREFRCVEVDFADVKGQEQVKRIEIAFCQHIYYDCPGAAKR